MALNLSGLSGCFLNSAGQTAPESRTSCLLGELLASCDILLLVVDHLQRRLVKRPLELGEIDLCNVRLASSVPIPFHVASAAEKLASAIAGAGYAEVDCYDAISSR